MASKSGFPFTSQAELNLSQTVFLFGQLFSQILPFYLFGIQVHLCKSQSWHNISFKKYTRERERQSGVGLSWCATLKSNRRFSAFLDATAELTVMLTQQNHTLICYHRSQVDYWPCAAYASGAQDSSFLPCDSRGAILLTNQLFSVLHYPQVTPLSKDVILLFLSDGLINRPGFQQLGKEVVVLDHQTKLPQRSWKVLSHDSSYGNSTNKIHWH